MTSIVKIVQPIEKNPKLVLQAVLDKCEDTDTVLIVRCSRKNLYHYESSIDSYPTILWMIEGLKMNILQNSGMIRTGDD